jgi:hypothetical protein
VALALRAAVSWPRSPLGLLLAAAQGRTAGSPYGQSQRGR